MVRKFNSAKEKEIALGYEMNENKTGPEFLPLKNFIKEFKITVTIYDANDNIVREEFMDYGKPADRIWLGKLSYYCWTNGYIVETKANG